MRSNRAARGPFSAGTERLDPAGDGEVGAVAAAWPGHDQGLVEAWGWVMSDAQVEP